MAEFAVLELVLLALLLLLLEVVSSTEIAFNLLEDTDWVTFILVTVKFH